MIVGDLSWVSQQPTTINKQQIEVKIRYRHEAVSCKIKEDGKNIKVEFEKPQRAITPGQSAVFYDDDEVLGGGIIVS
jgi:tRNA-specific 2-thiouridylase